jgi:hypothetical protein
MAPPRRPEEHAWQRLCTHAGNEFISGEFLSGAKVQARLTPWTVTLDTYTNYGPDSRTVCTRMRAPFVSSDGFRFTIYRNGLLSTLGKLLGMQDIEIGDPQFDDAFIIKGNQESKVFDLLSDASLRKLIAAQPAFRLTIKDHEGWFGPRFPEHVDELCFDEAGFIDDVERLQSLFELFAAMLERLCRIGAAFRSDPDLTL